MSCDHAALISDENMLVTVLKSLAVVVYEFSRVSRFVISASRLTPVALERADVACVASAF